MYNIESNSFNIMIIVIYFIYICKKFLQIYIMELAMTVKETIGKRIKEERTRLNLSQEDLAQKIGWKEHVKISSIERGYRINLSFILLLILSIFFRCSDKSFSFSPFATLVDLEWSLIERYS